MVLPLMQAESALLEVKLQFFPASLVSLSLRIFQDDERTAGQQERLQSLVQKLATGEGASLETNDTNEVRKAFLQQQLWVRFSFFCTALETILDFQKSTVT